MFVSSAEAAAFYGTTPDAVRMRGIRGQVERQKVGYVWHYWIPDPEPVDPTALSCYDPEKRKYTVRHPGKTTRNIPADDVDWVLSLVDPVKWKAVASIPRESVSSEYRSDNPEYLLSISMRDIHVGEDDFEAYHERVLSSLRRCLDRASRMVDAPLVIHAPIGSDLLHADTYGLTTTKGTQLKAAGDIFEIQKRAFQLERAATHLMAEYGYVVRFSEQGNHDRAIHFGVALAVSAAFEGCFGVEVQLNTAPRSYFQFGQCMIGSHHGHLQSPEQLSRVVPAEAAVMWGQTTHRYMLVGHQHHWRHTARDLTGLTVIQSRSPAPASDYEIDLGFHSPHSLQAHLFSADHGLVATFLG